MLCTTPRRIYNVYKVAATRARSHTTNLEEHTNKHLILHTRLLCGVCMYERESNFGHISHPAIRHSSSFCVRWYVDLIQFITPVYNGILGFRGLTKHQNMIFVC